MKTRVRLITGVVLAAFLASAPTAQSQQVSDPNINLAGLCKVWGLLKYFHPDVASSSDWDETLVAAIPRFKLAAGQSGFNQEVVNLIGEAGLARILRELRVGIPREAAALGPAFRWIDDDVAFAPATRTLLKAIVLAHRPGPNNYVAPGGAGNPDFSKDLGYASLSTSIPSEEIRLVALFRYWNMVQYYYPCKDGMDRDWNTVLAPMIPVFRQASTDVQYHLAVAQLTASITDAHAATSSGVLTLYWGQLYAPLRLRLVQGRTVVTRVYTTLLAPGVDILVGDVITHIDGISVETRRAEMAKFVNGSNAASLERNSHSNLVRTNAAKMILTIDRGGPAPFEVTVDCVGQSVLSSAIADFEAQAGAWTILKSNIGYVNMGQLQSADVPFVMGQMKDTRAIIFDIRNYPLGTLYDVSNYLNPATRPFVKFFNPDYGHPGSFIWTRNFVTGPGSPDAWSLLPTPAFTYAGVVVVLADQETQSQAEYTVMALKTAPSVIVVGSQTAGADGNVSLIRLPGGLSTLISGLGVFYPDGRPTQRIGIVPDIEIRPTISGLREGRDDVFDEAVRLLR